MGNIVAGDNEVLAIVVSAAQYDVTVRVARVEMIGCDPVEPRAEILFYLAHQIADKWLQVGELRTILWSNDEPELMTIARAPLSEHVAVGVVVLGAVEFAYHFWVKDMIPLLYRNGSILKRRP
jgi:hypothetical protein